MNYKMMAYILGNIMQAEGLLMSISALLALYKGEINELRAFLITIILLLVIGTAMKHFAPKKKEFTAEKVLSLLPFPGLLCPFSGQCLFI